jgi:hypothetical protein
MKHLDGKELNSGNFSLRSRPMSGRLFSCIALQVEKRCRKLAPCFALLNVDE